MQISYTWQEYDNIQKVASTYLLESGYSDTSDLISAIITANYPTVIDPLTAHKNPDGSWTSGIVPGTIVIIPGK